MVIQSLFLCILVHSPGFFLLGIGRSHIGADLVQDSDPVFLNLDLDHIHAAAVLSP